MGVHKLTTQEFVYKANKVHNNYYNYLKTIYTGSRDKVEIVCPIHGSFTQLACNHIEGYGCPKCARIKSATKAALKSKYTYEEFVEKSRKAHGNKFDYSKVQYINIDTKVEIVCPIHGSFFQIPRSHFKGKGCRECALDDQGKLSPKEFINFARKIHGNKYDYTKTVYVNRKSKVTITCPIHGDFVQTAARHIKGRCSGCPKCGIIATTLKLTKSTQNFINDAKKIHGNRYDYTNTVYENCKKNVIIRCKKHGDFLQRPSSHLNGNGCPTCLSSIGENIIKVFLDKKNIHHETQKTFAECKYKNKLRFDFYIPSLKLLIEVDGAQHFPQTVGKPIFSARGHIFTQQEYDTIKERDSIKNDYALKHDMKLIRIPNRNKTDRSNIISILEKNISISNTKNIFNHNFFGYD